MKPLRVQAEVKLDLETVAKWFAELDDDEQARFFVIVAKEAEEWPKGKFNFGPSHQWWSIGSHLRNCECSSEGARDLVRGMYEGLCNGTH